MILPLPFDSDLFGYPVGKFFWAPSNDESQFLSEAEHFQLVYIFSKTPLSFSSQDILHVDTKLTYLKTLDNLQSTEEIKLLEKNSKTKMDPHIQEVLHFLALESGAFSRFKTDPRLRQGEFEKLYRLWIKKAMSEGNILMAPEMAGMITFDIKGPNAQIGLIAVHPDHRRKSWGKNLVLAAETQAAAQGAISMLIPTQEANVPAVKLYSDLGYQLYERSYLYHFWKS
jgi:ribosomal protein S18 acetylase RimI-like enzyme